VSQQLGRTSRDAALRLQAVDRPVLAVHEQIAEILRNRLGRNHAELFASPRIEPDGDVTWTTALPGDVIAAKDLSEDRRLKLRQRAERMLSDIRGLGAQMRTEAAATALVGQMIEQAASLPSGEWLYSVGDKPVLVMWGHSDAAPPAPPAPAARDVPAASAVAGRDAPSSEAVVPAAAGTRGPASSRTPGPRWLFALLSLLVLAALGLWLLSRRVEGPVAGDLTAQIAGVNRHNAELENQIAQLRSRRTQFACVPGPAAEPASQADAPFPNDPYVEIEQRIAAVGRDCAGLWHLLDDPALHAGEARATVLRQQIVRTLATSCRERLISDAKNLCPGERPKEFAPELTIVFDASKSMKLSLLATLEDMREADRLEPQNHQRRMQGLPEIEGPGFREPRRITAAKEATESVVRAMPSDASIGLVMVENCSAARGVGFFAPDRRAALLSQIHAIQPIGATPLADGIAKAGQMLDGVNRESIMVVVSDGVESCGGDPCAVAQSLHAAKPHLKINVVDIMGAGAGDCLAQATGGKVFTARTAADLAFMTRRAAQDVLGPANCK
jgi:hypothetical protein